MSNFETKVKNSKRRHKNKVAAIRQIKIAENHGIVCDHTKLHKFAKNRSMNCGNPKCVLCSNPRRIFKERTIQELRMFQSEYED